MVCGVPENKVQARPWSQLLLGIIVMMSISSPQYVWTLFLAPLHKAIGAGLPALQVTFTIFVVLQTFFSPAQGFLIEKFGARVLISTGTLLSGLSWITSAYAKSLFSLYLTYGLLGGLGTGLVYVGTIGLMVRLFPDKRGLATGLVAGGYGMGAIFTTFPISNMLKTAGYAETLLIFGFLQGALGVLAALGLKNRTKETKLVSKRQPGYRWQEMLRTKPFWLLFLMMSLLSTSGLMIISEEGPIAATYHIGTALVFGLAALPLSLTISRFTNGLTRPFFGFISDYIGRENTMTIAFSLEALSVLLILSFVHNPLLFVIATSLAFFGWGEIFSLFPSTLTDLFGEEHATQNYGFLYMAQGIGSLLGGPVAAMLFASFHSWIPVLYMITGMDALAAILAFFVLKPVAKDWFLQKTSANSSPMEKAL